MIEPLELGEIRDTQFIVSIAIARLFPRPHIKARLDSLSRRWIRILFDFLDLIRFH
ncbi:MAG: hypothetical protein LBM75_08980 [Myxococcales bacterium]|nr:hypothetical protein [Myxococcales bacterium]